MITNDVPPPKKSLSKASSPTRSFWDFCACKSPTRKPEGEALVPMKTETISYTSKDFISAEILSNNFTTVVNLQKSDGTILKLTMKNNEDAEAVSKAVNYFIK